MLRTEREREMSSMMNNRGSLMRRVTCGTRLNAGCDDTTRRSGITYTRKACVEERGRCKKVESRVTEYRIGIKACFDRRRGNKLNITSGSKYSKCRFSDRMRRGWCADNYTILNHNQITNGRQCVRPVRAEPDRNVDAEMDSDDSTKNAGVRQLLGMKGASDEEQDIWKVCSSI